jgi:predicted nucleotidyltransferase
VVSLLLLYKDKILKEISEEFPKTDNDLTEIIIFGSVARDDFSPLSDIDLLMITENKKKTRKLFSGFRENIYAETGVVIPAIYITSKEFDNAIDPLYQTIKQEGKTLWKRRTN